MNNQGNGQKKEYILEGLGCANCAAKIEREVGSLDGITAANLDFITKTLTVEFDEGLAEERLFKQTETIAKSHESNITVKEKKAAAGTDQTENGQVSLKHRLKRYSILMGGVIFIVGMLINLPHTWKFVLFLVSFLLVGSEVLLKAFKNITKGQIFDENFLMCVATIGAFAIGEYPEGVAVMLFYQIGEMFQDMAVNHSRKSIAALMDIRPDFASLKEGDEVRRVSPEEVKVGDSILVKSGEKIPLDGRVIEGRAALDTSALTGESLPRDVGVGSEVLSGSINRDGMLTIQVTKEYGESTVSKILDLVQNASSKKAQTENFITKFARVYTPAVVLAALALAFLPPLLMPDARLIECIHRALVFLVVSCPCALVISIPLSFFGGIGGASRNGILIKGSNYLEALNRVDTAVFDKTGTLTKGTFTVVQVSPTAGWTDEQLLDIAAHAESFSNHPIALSIQKAYGRQPDAQRVSEEEEIAGQGLRVKIDGRPVLAGNAKLMEAEHIVFEKAGAVGTIIYLAADGAFAGYLVISDEVKPDSIQTIRMLRAMGVRTVMLTGDNAATAEAAAQKIGPDAVYAELLPQQKVEKLEMLADEKKANGSLVFVGDGINDAPVLARADVGIAMGGLGSDAAIEAADVVLMTDEPSKLVTALRIAKKTHRIVWQNIIFALGVKAVILVLGALGFATMWEAVFGDVGVALIAILNAMRAMRVEKEENMQ